MIDGRRNSSEKNNQAKEEKFHVGGGPWRKRRNKKRKSNADLDTRKTGMLSVKIKNQYMPKKKKIIHKKSYFMNAFRK